MGSKRAAILEAAIWHFATRGYREASTTDLARVTASAEATVFYHFESKEKLFLAVLTEVKNRVEEGFSQLARSSEEKDGLEVLDSVVNFYLQFAVDNEAEMMLLHRHHAYDLADGNEDCRRLIETIYDGFIAAFERAIRCGQKDGSMAQLPVHKTALMVYVMVDGVVRLKHNNLYEAGSLVEDLLAGCRRLVAAVPG